MTAELLQTLFWLWMNFYSSAHLSWYTWFHETVGNLESVDEDAIYLLVVSLGRATVNKRNDSTVFALLLVGLSRTPTDHVGFVVLPPLLRNLVGQSKAFATAVKQGKLELAWSLWPADGWQILEEIAKEHGSFIKSLSKEDETSLWKSEWIYAARATALVIAGSLSRPYIKEKEEMLKELVGCTEAWKGPMRSIRAYSIPQECLHWFTQRGALPVNKTTERELKNGLESALKGSQFWDELDWTSSDDAREEFFDTYFTSDIPDEWSAVDRKKSHGYGIIPPNANENLMRLHTFSRWFQHIPSKGLWSGIETAGKYMIERFANANNLCDTIYEAYEESDMATRFEKLAITPMKRKIEIVD